MTASRRAGNMAQSVGSGLADDDRRSLAERGDDEIRSRRMLVDISEIDKNGPATHPPAGFDIARPVADHDRTRAIDAEPFRGAAEHTRSGLAAIAIVALPMVTRLYVVERQQLIQPAMHLFDD